MENKLTEPALLKSISILESRMQSLTKEEIYGDVQGKENLESVFPISTQCLYYYLLGENYFQLVSLKSDKNQITEKNQARVDQWIQSCLESLENGMRLVSQILEPHESKKERCLHF
jgi:hypothetical protein